MSGHRWQPCWRGSQVTIAMLLCCHSQLLLPATPLEPCCAQQRTCVLVVRARRVPGQAHEHWTIASIVVAAHMDAQRVSSGPIEWTGGCMVEHTGRAKGW